MSPTRCFLLLALAALLVPVGCAEEGRLVDTFHDTIDSAGIDVLDVGVESGDLIVEGSPDATEIVVQVDLLSGRDSEDRDDEARHGLGLELRDMADGTALLTVRDPDINNYWADVTVSIPAALELIVLAESGDVRIERCAALSIDDDAGDMVITDVAGEVQIEDGAGDIDLVGVIGDVTVDDGGGDTGIEDVDGDVEIDDGAGLIDVAHVTGRVTIRDGGGDIRISDAGAVEIESDTTGSVSID